MTSHRARKHLPPRLAAIGLLLAACAPVPGPRLVPQDVTTPALKSTLLPGRLSGLAVADDVVWAIGGGHLYRLNMQLGVSQPPTAVAQTGLPLLPKRTLVLSRHGLWAASLDDGSVARIDSASGRLVSSIKVGPGAVGLAVTDQAAWITNYTEGSVSRIDPATNQVAATVKVGGRPTSIAADEDTAWVLKSAAETLTRIDARTNQVVGTMPVSGAISLAVGSGAVWVCRFRESAVDYHGSVLRIDPATERLVATIPVGRGPSAVTVADGAIWVLNFLDQTLSKIDPNTNHVTGSLDIAGPDRAWWEIAAAKGFVWVLRHRLLPRTLRPTWVSYVQAFDARTMAGVRPGQGYGLTGLVSPMR